MLKASLEGCWSFGHWVCRSYVVLVGMFWLSESSVRIIEFEIELNVLQSISVQMLLMVSGCS